MTELPPIDDHDRPSTSFPEDYVRRVVGNAMQERMTMLLDAYSTDDDPNRAATIRKTNHRLRGQRNPKRDMSLNQQVEVVTVLFSVEMIRDLVPVVPHLSLRRRDVLETAYADHSEAAEVWNALSPEFLTRGAPPELLVDGRYREISAYLSPEIAETVPDETITQFQLWRNPDTFGWDAVIYGRSLETVQRLHGAIATLRDATPEQVEDAYFAHFTREVRRAIFPFGLADPLNRAAMVLAVAMTHESESVGSFHGLIKKVTQLDPSAIAFDHALRTAFDAISVELTTPRYNRARRFGRFDLVRAAASAQSYFQSEPVTRVRDDGWSMMLAASGFGAPRGTATPTPRQAFGTELLRILPYDRNMARELDEFWPVGTVKKIISLTENRELDVTWASPFATYVIHSLRDVVLEAYYDRRVKNEQLGRTPPSTTVRSIHSELEPLAKLRANDVFIEARKRTGEVELRGTEADGTLAQPGDEPDADVSLQEFSTPTWVEYFLEVFPARRRDWLDAGAPGLASVRHLKSLESFMVWLGVEAELRDKPIALAAEGIAAAETSGQAQMLPEYLQERSLSDDIGATLDEAIRAWADATKPARGVRDVKSLVRTIMKYSAEHPRPS